MKNSNHLLPILDQFELSASRFCEDTSGLSCDIRNEYKGKESNGNLKSCSVTVVYPAFAVEFRYTARGKFSSVNSILKCYIHFDKSGAGISLPFIVAYYKFETVAPLTIPLITSASGMEQAFACLGGVLMDLLDMISAGAAEDEKKRALQLAYQDEIDNIFNLSESNRAELGSNAELRTSVLRSVDDYITSRYTSSALMCLHPGKTDRAIKKLEKEKKPTSYERHLLELMRSGIDSYPYDLSEIEKNAAGYNNLGIEKINFRELVSFFLAVFVLTIPVSAVLLAIYFLLFFLEGYGSVYLMGPLYNFPSCFFEGFLVSIPLAYFQRLRFYKRLFPNDYGRYAEMDAIQNGPGADKLMKVFRTLLIAVALVLTILLTKLNINFRPNGFVDNTSFFSLRGTFHSYDDVEYIFYRPDRVNGLGDTLDFPSYVMRLKDGTEIDFYEFDDISSYSDTLFDYLRNIGIEIKG